MSVYVAIFFSTTVKKYAQIHRNFKVLVIAGYFAALIYSSPIFELRQKEQSAFRGILSE
jgi:hypothetical protein